METSEQSLKICSKSTIKIPERRRKRLSVAFVNFEHISYIFSIVSIVDFVQVNVGWKVLSIYTVTLEFFIIRYQYQYYYNRHFFIIIASSKLSLVTSYAFFLSITEIYSERSIIKISNESNQLQVNTSLTPGFSGKISQKARFVGDIVGTTFFVKSYDIVEELDFKLYETALLRRRKFLENECLTEVSE